LKHKALVLLSGGLDSSLCIPIMLQQGLELETINFITPFCTCTRTKGCRYEAKRIAEEIGLPLKIFNISKEYIAIIKKPKYGYGRGLNPCIDCRIFMFKKAKAYMEEANASFIVTGEVLGQRPMSQHRRAMEIIEQESGLIGLVLRPLSAKLLKPTIPEERGWVNREQLLSISGRSRKPQIALAKELHLNEYPCAAGGCLLTDPQFAKRMRDLLTYIKDPSLNDIQLLKVGRHFRLSEELKIIVGRNEEENKRLSALANDRDIKFVVVNGKGALVICRGKINSDSLLKSASIAAWYSDDKGKSGIKAIGSSSGEEVLKIAPIDEAELEKLRI